MKHIFKLLPLVWLLGSFMASCVEDKGNYNYNLLDRIEVAYPTQEDTLAWPRGEVFHVPVQYIDAATGQKVLLDEQEYDFSWKTLKSGTTANTYWEEVSDKPNLDEPIFLDVTAIPHWITLQATHKETGVIVATTFRLRLTGAFDNAYLLLTEDEGGSVELELYGTTPAGEILHHTDYLSSNEFPYTGGGANGIVYDGYLKRVWIATGSGTGFLSTPDFSFDPLTNKLSDMLITPNTETFMKMVRFGNAGATATTRTIFGFSENGDVNILNNSGALFNPKINYLNSLEIQLAPMVGGYGQQSSAAIYWNKTDKNLVTGNLYHQGTSVMSRTVNEVDHGLNTDIEDCVFLGGSATRPMTAVVRDVNGEYWRLDFNNTTSSPYAPVPARDPKRLRGTAEAWKINHWFNSLASGYLYIVVGNNNLYSYVEDQTGVGVDDGWTAVSIVDTQNKVVTLSDPVSLIYVERNGAGLDDCFWVVTYSAANGSTIYRLTPGNTSHSLILEERITVNSRVAQMCYYWG